MVWSHTWPIFAQHTQFNALFTQEFWFHGGNFGLLRSHYLIAALRYDPSHIAKDITQLERKILLFLIIHMKLLVWIYNLSKACSLVTKFTHASLHVQKILDSHVIKCFKRCDFRVSYLETWAKTNVILLALLHLYSLHCLSHGWLWCLWLKWTLVHVFLEDPFVVWWVKVYEYLHATKLDVALIACHLGDAVIPLPLCVLISCL